MRKNKILSSWTFALILLSANLSYTVRLKAQEASEYTDLAELSLEELMDMEVVSVSKKAQRLIDVASAVHIITQEDIRRSGHTSIPELLRMVPGMHVGRISGSNWTISARGSNSIFANKLLVMIDGRSVYTPLFAGTYWALQDLLLDDIERIEVIRGPGATVWGANAVNGVINVITKSAAETPGTLITALAGNEEHAVLGVRQQLTLSDRLRLRISGNYRNTDGTVDFDNNRQSDDFRLARTNLRVDWEPSENDSVSILAGWYTADKGARNRRDTPASLLTGFGAQTVNTTGKLNGADLQIRWKRQISENTSTELRVITDYHHRNVEIFTQRRRNIYVDFQSQLRLNARHELVWGFGWRGTGDRLQNTVNLRFRPTKNREVLYSGFVQDEIRVIPELLTLTAGSKVEWNSYTGWEIQPSIRFMLQPTTTQQVWGAVTRAVRIPARADRELAMDITSVVPGAPFGPAFCPCPAGVSGNPDLDSEILVAYELGYRVQIRPTLHLDIATFLHDYENQRGFSPQVTNPFFFVANNRREGQAWGVEAAARWQIREWWRLGASYTSTRVRDSSVFRPVEFDVPEDQYQLSSHLDLPWNLELDMALYYVGSYVVGIPELSIDRYTRADVRFAWHPRPNLELSIAGQNLFDRRHPEGRDFVASDANEIERSVTAKIRWRF